MTTQFFYWRKESAVRLPRQIKIKHQLAKMQTGGGCWTATTAGPFVQMVISCKDYTATLEILFVTSRKAVAVSPATCPVVISAVMTRMSGNPSTTKAGATVIANIIWQVSTREVAINCTASKSSNVA